LKCFKLDFQGVGTGEEYFRTTVQYSVEHNSLKSVTFLSFLANRGTVQLEHCKQLAERIITHTSPPSTISSQERNTVIFPEEELNKNVSSQNAV